MSINPRMDAGSPPDWARESRLSRHSYAVLWVSMESLSDPGVERETTGDLRQADGVRLRVCYSVQPATASEDEAGKGNTEKCDGSGLWQPSAGELKVVE